MLCDRLFIAFFNAIQWYIRPYLPRPLLQLFDLL